MSESIKWKATKPLEYCRSLTDYFCYFGFLKTVLQWILDKYSILSYSSCVAVVGKNKYDICCYSAFYEARSCSIAVTKNYISCFVVILVIDHYAILAVY